VGGGGTLAGDGSDTRVLAGEGAGSPGCRGGRSACAGTARDEAVETATGAPAWRGPTAPVGGPPLIAVMMPSATPPAATAAAKIVTPVLKRISSRRR
jgi:hypothetical protein